MTIPYGRPGTSASSPNPLRHMSLSLAAVAALLVAGTGILRAQGPLAANLGPIRILQSPDDDDETASDISGIACMPGTIDGWRCMVINDEDRAAELVRIAGSALIGGDKVPLIGKKPSASTLGKEPQDAGCSEGKAKFKDLDGEGVAFAAPHFYVVGSHGCSRNSNKFRISSFILGRIPVDAQGTPGTVETSYRLADVLKNAPQVGAFFGKDLNGAGGLNIEGIAVAGGQLIVGLRAPVIDGKAFLVAVDLAHLFSGSSTSPPSNTRVIPLALGANTGIRDLATTPDGRLLVLAGPAQDQDVRYGLFLVDLAAPAALTHLATLRDVEEDGARAKPEGAVVLGATADARRLRRHPRRRAAGVSGAVALSGPLRAASPHQPAAGRRVRCG
jgi:uncharacterized protein DUF3616